MHSWRWSESNQFPPIQYVKDAELWKLPVYQQVRDKLGTAVPTPEISTDKGGFVTVSANKVHDAGDDAVSVDRYLLLWLDRSLCSVSFFAMLWMSAKSSFVSLYLHLSFIVNTLVFF